LKDAICPSCGAERNPEIVSRLERGEYRVSKKTLLQIGIPAYDIVRVAAGEHRYYVRLDGDAHCNWAQEVGHER
jgi:hypothetical protein